MDGLIYRAAVQSQDDPFEYVMSDETIDRMGEVVNADGWDLVSFKRNPIGLFNHHADAIIGRWENVRIIGSQLRARFVFAEEGTSEIVDTARKLWDQKILRGASVGFKALKREPLTQDADPHFGPFRYLKQQLFECSLVSVPANPNAMPVLRSFHLVPEISEQIFGVPAKEDQPASRVSASHPSRMTTMKTPLTKQIENQQAELNRLRDQLNSLISMEDDRDEDQETLFEELPKVISAGTKNLDKLYAAEKAMAFNAADQKPEGNGQEIILREPQDRQLKSFALPKKKIEPADYLFRAAASHLRAFASQMPVEQIVREVYGNDEATQIITRAAVNPATTTTAGYAAELVQTGWGGFLDRLLANSIYGPLSNEGTRYDLGRNGTLKIPYRGATTLASGAWVGEGAPKPVKQIGLATTTLTPHKLSCITVYTEEMAMSSVPAIEQILRKAMADDTQASLDGYLIDAVAESATRPAGLLVGVTPITASTAASSALKIIEDINNLIAPMEAANGGGSVVLIMNPQQYRKLSMATTASADFLFATAEQAATKFGVSRIIQSTTVTAGRVIAVDADWFATATGDVPKFMVSAEATLHMEDTAPLAIGTPGAPATVAAPTRSLYQTDSIAIRLSLYVTWMMVRASMVQTIAAVTW